MIERVVALAAALVTPAAARVLPFRTVLVLYAMLRQHGYSPRLHLGATGTALAFRAHAGTSLGGTAVVELAVVTGYRELVVDGG
ncbi:MAG: lasso peptide biosynthesis protein [Gemmatimonadaceae bacterium]